jgi:type II secretory pathway component PulF
MPALSLILASIAESELDAYAMIVCAWMVVLMIALALFLALAYLVSLPLSRRERARFFLDLIERGIQSGRPVEQVILELSELKDPSLGVGFHYLAACLERGMPLLEALEQARGFVPNAMTGMLKAGAAIGDISKIIPACRNLLRDGASQFIGGQNYLYAFLFTASPASILVLLGIFTVILPKYRAIWLDMGMTLPFLYTWLSSALPVFIVFQALVTLLLSGVAMFYMGGSRFASWFEEGFPRYGGWVRYHIPWQRRRMHRDFACVLAILLDSGVPEAESIKLASACTNNDCFGKLTGQALHHLMNGLKLPEAVLPLDVSGELSWRLANAGRSREGFASSLRAWHEALDAKAFQQEQTFAQGFSSSLVVMNGILVLATALVAFMPLYAVLNEALLW